MIPEYREIWLVDFEFQSADGERPIPVCMVAKEWRSGRMLRIWQDELRALRHPPFSVAPEALFVAYYASAELGCFLALGWQMPASILDLCAEFKLLTCGLQVDCGRGLLGALKSYGIGSAIEAADKDSMRQLALRGGPYTEAEKLDLLNYCQTDVDALKALLPKMMPTVDMPRALLRGRYMAAVAKMEWNGVPLDVRTLSALRNRWNDLQDRLIATVDEVYGVFEGRTFKADRWAEFLARNNIPWPHHQSGSLILSEETFKDMSVLHPVVAPIYQLRQALSQLRLNDLAVGRDGRNRCMLSAFASRTGRNQPSTSKYIFGPAVWLRSLIKPPPSIALAYIDFEQQEFGIGAALSGDVAMKAAYRTGDPYLTFAKQAGAVPASATKCSHESEGDKFKQCALGVQYGMGETTLAQRLNETTAKSRDLLRLHKETYPGYWQWSDAIETTALLTSRLNAAFGWAVNIDRDANPRSLRNFPLQANGAEMLRIGCILAIERGVKVCAPVHDAVLIEADDQDIDNAVHACQKAMREASELVLAGFSLRTDATIIRWPDRYSDKRGKEMWKTIVGLLSELDGSPLAKLDSVQ